VELPSGADGQPILPEAMWEATPGAVQALVVALLTGVAEVATLRERVRELEARLGQNSSNSSRPGAPWAIE
jgi:hypothetical protein